MDQTKPNERRTTRSPQKKLPRSKKQVVTDRSTAISSRPFCVENVKLFFCCPPRCLFFLSLFFSLVAVVMYTQKRTQLQQRQALTQFDFACSGCCCPDRPASPEFDIGSFWGAAAERASIEHHCAGSLLFSLLLSHSYAETLLTCGRECGHSTAAINSKKKWFNKLPLPSYPTH